MQNISQKLIELLNYRIQQEEYSSRLYKAMSIWLNYKGYNGASKLFDKYSKEELVHAEWAYNYLLDLDVMPVIPAIEKPNNEFNGIVDIINKAYEHEQKVTNQCQELASNAIKEGDYMTLELAQMYLKEQTEELAKTNYWLNRLNVFGQSETSLFMLDNEMKNGD